MGRLGRAVKVISLYLPLVGMLVLMGSALGLSLMHWTEYPDEWLSARWLPLPGGGGSSPPHPGGLTRHSDGNSYYSPEADLIASGGLGLAAILILFVGALLYAASYGVFVVAAGNGLLRLGGWLSRSSFSSTPLKLDSLNRYAVSFCVVAFLMPATFFLFDTEMAQDIRMAVSPLPRTIVMLSIFGGAAILAWEGVKRDVHAWLKIHLSVWLVWSSIGVLSAILLTILLPVPPEDSMANNEPEGRHSFFHILSDHLWEPLLLLMLFVGIACLTLICVHIGCRTRESMGSLHGNRPFITPSQMLCACCGLFVSTIYILSRLLSFGSDWFCVGAAVWLALCTCLWFVFQAIGKKFIPLTYFLVRLNIIATIMIPVALVSWRGYSSWSREARDHTRKILRQDLTKEYDENRMIYNIVENVVASTPHFAAPDVLSPQTNLLALPAVLCRVEDRAPGQRTADVFFPEHELNVEDWRTTHTYVCRVNEARTALSSSQELKTTIGRAKTVIVIRNRWGLGGELELLGIDTGSKQVIAHGQVDHSGLPTDAATRIWLDSAFLSGQ